MRNSPSLYELHHLIETVNAPVQMTPDGKRWYPCRPSGFHSIGNRLRCAWAVFTGRADAVIWPAGQ